MNHFKISKLLSYLIAPFMMFAGEEDTAGAAPTVDQLAAQAEADAIARGDIIVDPAAEKKAAETGKVDDPLAKEQTAEEKAAADAAKAEADAAAAKAEAEAKMTPEEKAAADAAKAEADAADAAKKKDSRIPQSRHEAILAKEREKSAALQAQLDAAQRGQHKAVVNEDIAKSEEKLTTLEAEYNELITNGDTKAATAKMAEIRRLDNQIGAQRLELATSTAERNAVERVRFDAAVTHMEDTYSVLKPGSADFDQEKVDEVLRLMGAFRAGDPTLGATDALRDAVKYAMGDPVKAAKATKEDEPADDKAAKAAKVEADRKADAIARGIAAAAAQPASTANVGKNSDDAGKLTAERAAGMSQKEFAKLPEAELAKLRGDVVA